MRKETREAEHELRRMVDRLGHDFVGVSVDEYEDDAVVHLEVEIDAPNPYQIK